MHIGSLYTAAASFLDARVHGGRWLLRIEDLDRPREVAGCRTRILRTLESFGFEWDGPVVRQVERTTYYEAAIESLARRGLTFACSCSRARLADEERYPGSCRQGALIPEATPAIRLRVDPGFVWFDDRIQGRYRQDVAAAVGDVILKRRDGIHAYLLAVVVDDAAQGVTHVVRGADLLDNTPRQIYLQRLFGLPPPSYAHVPVLTEADGSKLAKSARSVPVSASAAVPQMLKVFELLGLAPPAYLIDASLHELWAWAMQKWSIKCVFRRFALRLTPEKPDS